MFFDDYHIEWQVDEKDNRFAEIAEERMGQPLDLKFHSTELVKLRNLSLKKLVSWLMNGLTFCPEPVEAFIIMTLAMLLGEVVRWDDPNVDEIMQRLFRYDGGNYVSVADLQELSETHPGFNEALNRLVHEGVLDQPKNGRCYFKGFAIRSRRIDHKGREYINPMRRECEPPKPDPVFQLTFDYQPGEYPDDKPAVFPVRLHNPPEVDIESQFILPAKKSKEFSNLIRLARKILGETYTFDKKYHWIGGGRVRMTQSSEMKELGQQLYDGLFHGTVKERFLSATEKLGPCEVLRIRLCFQTNHPQAIDLCNYPWELLFDGEHFIALYPARNHFPRQHPPIALTRQLVMSPRTFELAFKHKPNLTMIRLSATDLGLDDELKQLNRAFGASVECAISQPGSLLALREHLEKVKPHIVHFAGHGELIRERYVCELSDENVEADTLAETLAKAKVQLVVVNCCHSLRIQKPCPHYFDLTCALTHAGVGAVVVMQSLNYDKDALEFSRIFYENLFKFKDIELALTFARHCIARRKKTNQNWFKPVLFYRPPGT